MKNELLTNISITLSLLKEEILFNFSCVYYVLIYQVEYYRKIKTNPNSMNYNYQQYLTRD